uniref:stamen-specific protein FIL1-like n=1 Tax=Erigeron canadensis TaxID=72917 RepID=UPI001CB93BA8|nr:stamen-specific protein FIL1-like [Erigeron canadensis]
MDATRVSQISQVALLALLVLALVVGTHGQTCPNQLGNLNVCAPFVLPGSTNNSTPNSECCSALQTVDLDCLCNTIRIASLLPAQCNLPVTCGIQ